MATASSNPFMPHLITCVGDLSSANVFTLSRTITNVESLAERLKRLRKAQKLSQAKLASKAGVSQSAVGMIESGERENPQILVPLAAALGVSVEFLATGKGLHEQRVVMSEAEAELIDHWQMMLPEQQDTVRRIIQQHIDQNQAVLAAFGGQSRTAIKTHDPKIIDPTLPAYNEFTDYAEQRKHERREQKIQVEKDRRNSMDRRKEE